jgi:hypothetical protein
MQAKPIGTVTVWRGQRHIKVSHHGRKRQRWRPVARHWWEQNVGPVPVGHQVYHRDGDPLNDSPENLVLAREDRLRVILAANRKSQHRQRVRHSTAIRKANSDRARVYNAVLRPQAWYIVLPQSKAILWVPCRRRTEAKELFPPVAIADLCAKDEAILNWRDLRPRNIESFQPGHEVLICRGSQIEAESGQDGRFEGFIRLIPDTRKPPRKRTPKFLPPDLVTVWGDGYVSGVVDAELLDPMKGA